MLDLAWLYAAKYFLALGSPLVAHAFSNIDFTVIKKGLCIWKMRNKSFDNIRRPALSSFRFLSLNCGFLTLPPLVRVCPA